MAEANGQKKFLMWFNGALIAGAFVGATIYFTHLKWAAEKGSEVDAKLATASSERAQLRTDVGAIVTNQELMRRSIQKLARSVDRLADQICYRDTGKPCPGAMMNEDP